MKRHVLNFVIDLVTLVVMLGVTATGLLLRWILVPGSRGGRGLEFLAWAARLGRCSLLAVDSIIGARARPCGAALDLGMCTRRALDAPVVIAASGRDTRKAVALRRRRPGRMLPDGGRVSVDGKRADDA
jgi:hypothetical protein